MQSNTPQTDDYEIQFVQTSQQTFHRTPYEWQSAVGSAFLRDYYNNKYQKILLVRPTSGGKSLVFNTISVCIKGVTVCISPLLSLGADQSRKVIQAAHNDRSVSSFHLDEMHQSSVKRKMATRQISFNLSYSSQPLRYVKKSVKRILHQDSELESQPLPKKILIYANRRTRINHFADSIESFLDSEDG